MSYLAMMYNPYAQSYNLLNGTAPNSEFAALQKEIDNKFGNISHVMDVISNK